MGSDLLAILRVDNEVMALGHAEIEVSDLGSVCSAINSVSPDIVINTAAYHKVEEVEENAAWGFAVNAIGPRNLALVCKELNAALVHLSTDYVFSGTKKRPYIESDCVEPVNMYGSTKAAGEMVLRYIWSRSYIVRSSGLYGRSGSSGKGGNFVELMLRLAREGRLIRVVSDQILTPTSTRSLALQIAVLIKTNAYGTYHATCQGECSWFEFAVEIFQQSGLKPDLASQSTAQSGARVKRPAYSVLENANLKRLGSDIMPDWKDALHQYLKER